LLSNRGRETKLAREVRSPNGDPVFSRLASFHEGAPGCRRGRKWRSAGATVYFQIMGLRRGIGNRFAVPSARLVAIGNLAHSTRCDNNPDCALLFGGICKQRLKVETWRRFVTSPRHRHPKNCSYFVALAGFARSAALSLKPLHKVCDLDLMFNANLGD